LRRWTKYTSKITRTIRNSSLSPIDCKELLKANGESSFTE
jgi:hypothetical protein